VKIFLDTANFEDIRTANDWGVIDGVTTNPTLAGREGRPFREIVEEICDVMGERPVSAEVVATDIEGMLKEAREVSSWASNVVVKIPLIPTGIQAITILYQEGIKVNCTLCFSPAQALFAAKAGATYVSPFIGRLDDIGHDGMELVAQIRQILDNYDNLDTQIITSSVRHTRHIVRAALLGSDVATVPFKVLEKAFHHALTDVGLQRFLNDWEEAGLSIF